MTAPWLAAHRRKKAAERLSQKAKAAKVGQFFADMLKARREEREKAKK